tara:strand:- start:297 stop:812 length:516 start_codon:yes stop_codon:yes gene_type:complete
MATTTTHTKYGSALSPSVKLSNSSKYKQRKGLAYPLIGELTTITGDITSANEPLKNTKSQGGYFSKSQGVSLIRNNLRQLFLCEKGERVMLPNYGLSLNRYLFEPLDETTFYLVKTDILSTIAKYYPIVDVIKLKVFKSPKLQDEHHLIVQLTLQILDKSLEIFDVEVTLS